MAGTDSSPFFCPYFSKAGGETLQKFCVPEVYVFYISLAKITRHKDF